MDDRLCHETTGSRGLQRPDPFATRSPITLGKITSTTSAANILLDADGDLAVGEVVERDLAEGVAEAMGDLVGEREVGPAAEDLDPVVVHAEAGHRLFSREDRPARIGQGLPPGGCHEL